MPVPTFMNVKAVKPGYNHYQATVVCIAVMELKNVRRCKWEQVVVNLAQLRRHLHSVIKSIRVNHTYNNQ